jgi:hypothetical protein
MKRNINDNARANLIKLDIPPGSKKMEAVLG